MKNIILFGMKHAGKTTLARALSEKYNRQLFVTDNLLVDISNKKNNEQLKMREIAKKYGEVYFRNLELQVIQKLQEEKITDSIVDPGGGAVLDEKKRVILKSLGICIWIRLDKDTNYERIMKHGTPAFFPYQENPKKSFEELWSKRYLIYESFADYIIDAKTESVSELVHKVEQLKVVTS